MAVHMDPLSNVRLVWPFPIFGPSKNFFFVNPGANSFACVNGRLCDRVHESPEMEASSSIMMNVKNKTANSGHYILPAVHVLGYINMSDFRSDKNWTCR